MTWLLLTILALLGLIIYRQGIIMTILDTLNAEVAENKTVMASAVALLEGLKAKLDAAGTDPAKLAELSASLSANTDALAAAVVANTPAETNPA